MKKQSRRAINKEPLDPSLKACRKVSQEETTDDLQLAGKLKCQGVSLGTGIQSSVLQFFFRIALA